jgi:hypothetical protein
MRSTIFRFSGMNSESRFASGIGGVSDAKRCVRASLTCSRAIQLLDGRPTRAARAIGVARRQTKGHMSERRSSVIRFAEAQSEIPTRGRACRQLLAARHAQRRRALAIGHVSDQLTSHAQDGHIVFRCGVLSWR